MILFLVAQARRKPANRCGDALLRLFEAEAPDIDPCQPNVVRVVDFSLG